jgi:cytochrome c peroxidase
MTRTSVIIFAAACCSGAIAAYAAETVQISQQGVKFSTKELSASPGTVVVFHNDDATTHNITVQNPGGKQENSGSQKPGEDFSVNLTEAGTYDVHCLIHPKMKMTIDVK